MVRQQLILILFHNLNTVVGNKVFRDGDMVNTLRLIFCQQFYVVFRERAEQSLSARLRKIVVVRKTTVEVAANTHRCPSAGQQLDIVELLRQRLQK